MTRFSTCNRSFNRDTGAPVAPVRRSDLIPRPKTAPTSSSHQRRLARKARSILKNSPSSIIDAPHTQYTSRHHLLRELLPTKRGASGAIIAHARQCCKKPRLGCKKPRLGCKKPRLARQGSKGTWRGILYTIRISSARISMRRINSFTMSRLSYGEAVVGLSQT